MPKQPAKRAPATKAAARPKRAVATRAKVASPKLLSGGNPQIAIGDGDGPVQEYIAAMPGWKREVGEQLDAIISRAAPDAMKAVKWNSPFYGVDGKGWFISFHCLTKYVKVAFFDGALLRPVPPVSSKSDNVRYLHVFEGDDIDEAQFATWVKQATKLPGWSKA
jgi:hypothetical protein